MKNKQGFTIDEYGDKTITVQDLIDFLNDAAPDATVGVDKDGWMMDEINAESPQELIQRRGLFYISANGTSVIINN